MSSSAIHDLIPVVCASGAGGTRLAAFHAALKEADLASYNLVRLSSVIPPATHVDRTGKAPVPAGGWGDLLYCVYAARSATLPGEEAWAGIGWVQRLDGQGGLFVEHEGTSEDLVSRAIAASLRDLVAGAQDRYSEPDWVVTGSVCVDRPVCSLVIAPYECASWAGAR